LPQKKNYVIDEHRWNLKQLNAVTLLKFALCFSFLLLSSAAKRFISMSVMLMSWERSNQTVVSIFRRQVEKHPNKAAFLLDDKKLTFKEVKFDFLL
jgi:hypothetical protein